MLKFAAATGHPITDILIASGPAGPLGHAAGALPGSQPQRRRCTLIDVETCLKDTRTRTVALLLLLAMLLAAPLWAQAADQNPSAPATKNPSGQTDPGSPPSGGGFFPLSQVHRGLIGTAWTVFEGTQPEPMQVEILGVLRGARGPGQDMILAQLKGARPQYTGVVDGMSGSPVYIGNQLLGSLSYRIGQFSKDPIAGITPIAQMLEVRDLPLATPVAASPAANLASSGPIPTAADSISVPGTIQAIQTPLVMSGFLPQAMDLWRKQMAGTNMEEVMAGGMGGGSSAPATFSADSPEARAARASLLPGSAVSAQLVRGDLEISATCTVTYVDPSQLLACGHPILQAGPVSLPMTTAEVVATLASPMDAFKIINTGQTIGAFTEDRESGIRGVMGETAHMIPVHISVDQKGSDRGLKSARSLNVEVLDLPALTPQAVMVTLYDALLENDSSTAETSYHVTGSIDLEGYAPSPLNLWVSAGANSGAPLQAALLTGEHFAQLYSNGARQGSVRSIDLEVQAIPRRLQVELLSARLVSDGSVHAGDTVTVEATLRPWQQPLRNVRIPVKLPDRLGAGNLRLLVSDAATLDRTLNQPQMLPSHPADLQTLLAEASHEHAADTVYVSLLVPESQAEVSGQTLTSLPLSMANALEPLRSGQGVQLNGESADVAASAPVGGVLTGFQILDLHIEPGGGLN